MAGNPLELKGNVKERLLAVESFGDLSKLTEPELVTVVATLLRKMGYDVERDRWVMGSSGTRYEVDIYAEKQKLLGLRRGYSMLVECKIGSSDITVEALRRLHFIFEDINSRITIDKLQVVTNSSFTHEAKEYAALAKIELVDGELLRKRLEEHEIM